MEAESAAEQAKSDEAKAKRLTGEEERIAEDVDDSEAAAKRAQQAASSDAAAEVEQVKSAQDDAAAVKTAQDMADSAADKAVDAKNQVCFVCIQLDMCVGTRVHLQMLTGACVFGRHRRRQQKRQRRRGKILRLLSRMQPWIWPSRTT